MKHGMTTDYETIGSNLKAARKHIGLTLQSAAYKAGLDASDLFRYENGIFPPSVEAFNRLLNLYNSYYSKFIFTADGKKQRVAA